MEVLAGHRAMPRMGQFNAGTMLGQRQRRWPSIGPALGAITLDPHAARILAYLLSISPGIRRPNPSNLHIAGFSRGKEAVEKIGSSTSASHASKRGGEWCCRSRRAEVDGAGHRLVSGHPPEMLQHWISGAVINWASGTCWKSALI